MAVLILVFCAFSAEAITFSIGENFTGSTFSQSGFFPPDTMGGVGNDHIVALINGRFAVWDKTGSLQQAKSLNQFWIDAGETPAGSYAFDPRVLYDNGTDRWFATSVDNARGANNFLVAVSDTSDPTLGWTGFKIDSDTDNTHWADFPTMGIDDEGLYISANMFPISSGGVETTLLVLPKADLLAGSVAGKTLFENNIAGFSAQPIVDLDNTGLPAQILSAFPGSFRRTDITDTINAPALETKAFISVTPKSAPPTADQPGPKDNIHTGDDRLSSNVVLQDGSVWGVQSVEIDGRSALRWFEIINTNHAGFEIQAVNQEGFIEDSDLSFYYGSIAVNEFGQVVIGFSGSGADQFVSSYAVVGETVDGMTAFSDTTLLKAGLDDYERLDGSGRNRWGDYSATVLDPTDPYTFWTFQEFVYAENIWAVQITEINTIPIPMTAILFASGLIGLFGLRRKKVPASHSS
ncbi:MAG: hypothetical protein JRJ85_08840 [Deltaproteobacteria bacterium]|nr:hypothetical protein [Deltaproteobacteria bacterium]